MIYKIMKNRNNILGELACIAACIAVSVFFLNSLCPYWDDGASVRPVYDYFALGIDSHSWYGEGWFFNLYKLIPTVAYFVGGGYSTYSALLIHAIWSGMCLYLAMHLAISQSRDSVRSWSTILFLVFIYLPTNTETVWIRYHKPATFFILAFLFLIFFEKNELNIFPFKKKVVLLGIVLLIYGWICCADYLLLIEGIILPIGLYFFCGLYKMKKVEKGLLFVGLWLDYFMLYLEC